MVLLGLVFVTILVIAFLVIVVMLRVPADQRAIEQRLDSLQGVSRPGGGGEATPLFKDKPSAAMGVSAWFAHLRLVHWVEQLVYQSTGSRTVGPTMLWTAVAGTMGAAVTLLISGMAPVAVIAGTLLGTLPLARLWRMRQKRLQAFEKALPDCIDTCARALRAGLSLVAAIGLVAEDAPEPAKTEFAEIFRKHNFGLPLRDALTQTMERVPSPDFRVFVTGILVQKDTGGNLTEVFDRIVAVIRERIRIQGEIRVHTTQGRMTGWILTLLPVGLLVVINLVNPGYSRLLFTDPTGKKLMYAGLVLLLIGGLVIRRIVNGIEV